MVIIGKDPTRYSPMPIIAVCSFWSGRSGMFRSLRDNAGFIMFSRSPTILDEGASFRHHDDIAVDFVLFTGKFGGEEQHFIDFLLHLGDQGRHGSMDHVNGQ